MVGTWTMVPSERVKGAGAVRVGSNPLSHVPLKYTAFARTILVLDVMSFGPNSVGISPSVWSDTHWSMAFAARPQTRTATRNGVARSESRSTGEDWRKPGGVQVDRIVGRKRQ